ncbi:unnamed protein product [Adineta ricciae]|uniref:G-protein coupled receptors family 1 profile domain-containing protein n=1 Tax=Adineta ricciae TaxID=249248 RepID=A0A815JHC9_ADIRI|nr:unnamed protein product [Adineta ricciae]
MSLNDTELINFLVSISNNVNRYFPTTIFLIGTIGNILNILTLSQRRLRQIPCVFFFLISSICSLISIDFGLITRVLSGFVVDPTYTIGWFCKFRTFVVFSTRAMVFWLIVMATIDRWLSSSIQTSFRQKSSMKNAYRATIFVIFLSMIVYGQLLYCYDANLINAPFKCYAKNYSRQLLADLTFVCFTTIVPILVMLVFGLLTILNIRQSQRRVLQMSITNSQTSVINELQIQTRKNDRSLLRMILVQVFLLGSLTLPQAIQRLYAVLIDSSSQSKLQSTIDMFIYNIVLLLTYLASAMQFYIFTLTGGTLFRQALFDLIKSFFNIKYLCQK